jgi:hypothetical protein
MGPGLLGLMQVTKSRESNGQVGGEAADRKSFPAEKPPARPRFSFLCCFGRPQVIH